MIIIGGARGGRGKRGEAVGLRGEDFNNIGMGDFSSNSGTFAQHIDLERNNPLDGKKGLFHDHFLFFADEPLEVNNFFSRLGRGRGKGRRGRSRGSSGNRILEVSVGIDGNGADGFGVVEHDFLHTRNQSIHSNKFFSEVKRFREVKDCGDGFFSDRFVLVREEENKGR